MAIADFYRDPLVIQWYIDPLTKQKITTPRYNESYKIVKNTITLAEIPAEHINTIIIGNTMLYENSYSNVIDVNHFVVNYTVGVITVDSSFDGQTALIPIYNSRGVIYYPSSRIYSTLDENGNVLETINETILNKSTDFDNLIASKSTDLTNLINTQSYNLASLYNTFSNLGEYDNTLTYVVHNIVTYYGSSYMCISNSTDNLPTNQLYWKLLSAKGNAGASLNFKGIYNNGFTYSINDLVSYQGSVYYCLKTSIGHLPTDSSYWSIFIQGTIITTYKNTYTITGTATNTVPIGITGYNKSTDTLLVFANSTYIEETKDYTIDSNSLNIVKISGTWNGAGATIFNFVVFKNINVAYYADGNFIMDGTIGKSKLSTSLQNEINLKKTIIVSYSQPSNNSYFWIDINS